MPEGQKFYSKNLADLGGGTFPGIEKKKDAKNKKKGWKFKKEEAIKFEEGQNNNKATPKEEAKKKTRYQLMGSYKPESNKNNDEVGFYLSADQIKRRENPNEKGSLMDGVFEIETDNYDTIEEQDMPGPNLKLTNIPDKPKKGWNLKTIGETIPFEDVKEVRGKPTGAQKEKILDDRELADIVERQYNYWKSILIEIPQSKEAQERNKRDLKDFNQGPVLWIKTAINNSIRRRNEELSNAKTDEERREIRRKIQINEKNLKDLELAIARNLPLKFDKVIVEEKTNTEIKESDKERKFNLIEEGTIVIVKRTGVKRNIVYKIGKKKGDKIPFDNLTDGTRGSMTPDQMKLFLFAPGIDFVLNKYNEDINKEPKLNDEPVKPELNTEQKPELPKNLQMVIDIANELGYVNVAMLPREFKLRGIKIEKEGAEKLLEEYEAYQKTQPQPVVEIEQAPKEVGEDIPESLVEDKEAEMTVDELIAQYWAEMAKLEELEEKIADIEKRREEDLIKNVDGYRYERDYRPDNTKIFDKILKDWIDTGEYTLKGREEGKYLNGDNQGYVDSIDKHKKALKSYLEINAKYDAELAALQPEEEPEIKIDMDELKKNSPATADMMDLLGVENVEASMNAMQAEENENKNRGIEVPNNIEEYENLLKTDKVFFNQEYIKHLPKIKDFDENIKFRNSSDEEVIRVLLEEFNKSNPEQSMPIENKEVVKTYYAKFAWPKGANIDGDLIFKKDMVSETENGEQVFELKDHGDGTATISLNSNISAQKYYVSVTDWKNYIDGFELMNNPVRGITKMELVEEGEAKKNSDGSWDIIKKPKVKFVENEE